MTKFVLCITLGAIVIPEHSITNTGKMVIMTKRILKIMRKFYAVARLATGCIVSTDSKPVRHE